MFRTTSSRILLGGVCIFCLALGSVSLSAPAAGASDRVGPKAVWKASPEVIVKLRAECSADPAKVGACFTQFMQSAGASSEAVAFAKSLADKGYGYLRAFRRTGRVDIAYVEYVFRANEMEGVFLVNGDPPMIDVDDGQYLSPLVQQKNTDYAALLRQYPQATVWPADRGETNAPTVVSSTHGQQFDVEYRLRNGCHACAQIGTELVAFRFDDSGRFHGTMVLGVRPRQT
jgi:hypothetical protein